MRIIGRSRVLLTARAVAVAVVSALVLAGCGSGPSQVTSAAIVGDHSIPLDAVQSEIQWLLDNVPEAQQAREQRKFDTISRQIVQSRIVHHLLGVATEREGLRVDPREVTELVDSAGGVDQAARSVGVTPDRIRDVAADQLLLQQLGQRYVDRLSVDFVGTVITQESPGNTAEDQARDLGERLVAAPAAAPRVLREAGHQVIDQRMSLAQAIQSSPELAGSALFGSAPGTVVVIQPSRQESGWLVALVKDRQLRPANGGGTHQSARVPGLPAQADPTRPDPHRPDATRSDPTQPDPSEPDAAHGAPSQGDAAQAGTRQGEPSQGDPAQTDPGQEDPSQGGAAGQPNGARQSDPQQLYRVGLRMLQPIAEELGVRVNPRYGVWDAAGMSVVPSEEEVTGHLLHPRTVQP
ncbi:SurA N-terminal domain-containing protein [Amycolatopsis arida]|uniref:SurA N-terminal domain-containing protein n=1 Tax=Amycolatopsis arida TaxID=587909 RepID=A0A1I5Q0B2_9PSEU|nr:SurA N-terminal domain-containing protein [Amycolatopsis arida]TDX98671.1 SurA-like protein [Amycolatopsis arida]SFP39665.1 SurA N-terminal domain-containing protein [Amycolatopsis arida]